MLRLNPAIHTEREGERTVTMKNLTSVVHLLGSRVLVLNWRTGKSGMMKGQARAAAQDKVDAAPSEVNLSPMQASAQRLTQKKYSVLPCGYHLVCDAHWLAYSMLGRIVTAVQKVAEVDNKSIATVSPFSLPAHMLKLTRSTFEEIPPFPAEHEKLPHCHMCVKRQCNGLRLCKSASQAEGETKGDQGAKHSKQG
ncbi:hypothetical protein BSKO_12060 [Bryopsis sp. KO-2023]|nr:hypothetical protein BSKO_12060 [Bryopsis sp. KO-2023]